jgi:hypothetical protein
MSQDDHHYIIDKEYRDGPDGQYVTVRKYRKEGSYNPPKKDEGPDSVVDAVNGLIDTFCNIFGLKRGK